MDDDVIVIEEIKYNLEDRVIERIFNQLQEIRKYCKDATIVLIHPAAFFLLQQQETFMDFDDIYGLKVIIDETVDVNKMVEVRGITSGMRW